MTDNFVNLCCAGTGIVTSTTALIYIFHQKLLRTTYHVTYLHLITTNMLCCSIQFLFLEHLLSPVSVPLFISITIVYLKFLSVLPVTLDRFLAVVKPHRYGTPFHQYLVATCITGCWVTAIVSASFRVFFSEWGLLQDGITVAFFGVTPTLLNTTSFLIILPRIKASPERSSMVMVRCWLITSFYCLSWLPPTVASAMNSSLVDFFDVMYWFYLSAITDPLIYLMPRGVLVWLGHRCSCCGGGRPSAPNPLRLSPRDPAVILGETPGK